MILTFILTIEGFDANGLSIGGVEFPLADSGLQIRA